MLSRYDVTAVDVGGIHVERTSDSSAMEVGDASMAWESKRRSSFSARSTRLNVQCSDHDLDKLNDTRSTVLKFRTFNLLCDFLFLSVGSSCNLLVVRRETVLHVMVFFFFCLFPSTYFQFSLDIATTMDQLRNDFLGDDRCSGADVLLPSPLPAWRSCS